MMKQQGPSRLQTCVLRVNIHCDGCRKKVKKLVQKINGVQNISIDAELGKVTVMGYIDPRTVIKKLIKSGKHAEIWRAQEKSFHNQNQLNHQFKNMQIQFSNSNGGERDKYFQKGGGNGFGHIQPKGSKDMMQMVPKAKKSVTFDLDEDDEDYVSDDSLYDSDDDLELDLGSRTPRKPSPMGVAGAYGQTGTKGMKKAKKGGIFRIPMLGKGQGKKNEGKYGKGGKNDKCGGKNSKNSFNGGYPKQSGPKNGAINRNYGNGGGGGKKMNSGFDIDFTNPGKGRGGAGRGGGGSGYGAPVPQIGNYPMGHQGQMGNFPAVGGLPAPMAMNGGGYGPMAGPGNAYNQQHPMAMMMMMNQQSAHGNEMLRPMPMMYGRPHPMMNYHQQPMPMVTTARGYSDPYTHMFSDENTESCSIM
ncbi:heavy metal-associated isoprenylated plant protein 32-like [Syzygium oleosum]|uniref:heavy metal-associated isoprenylated plant protein 32-like n=1 Tax=Syzygium oleosum TaxID=219896 RepID=UPI0011D20BEB|nr:heavy metal-associated isoprenylated plant protein 32-like [Syzygium oleosum]XP_056168220.1 heavy metal-associated isoprenylated plant protein 32-like [Syzygium oleosum]